MQKIEWAALAIFCAVCAILLLALVGEFNKPDYSIVTINGGYMICIKTNMPEAELRAKLLEAGLMSPEEQ